MIYDKLLKINENIMHKAKALVITCMDFRFQNAIRGYLKKNGILGDCDRIVIAGGSRDFVCPVKPQFSSYVWTQLELSLKLHDPKEVIVIDHQDCGGYAQDGKIPKGVSKDKDEKGHIKVFVKFKKLFNAKYPLKPIRFLNISLDGIIEEVIV